MAAANTQMVMPFASSPSYHAEDFIRGDANLAALSLIERWPDWPYSLVVVHGPKGSGKTHLAHVFANRTHAQFIPPSRIGQAPADQLLTGNHAWVIDGLDAVKSEDALAQLINHARARGDYVLMTANHAPSQLSFSLKDLTSRLTALPEVALGLPDEALLTGVLAKAFADRQLRVGPDMLHYAIPRLERSFEAVQQFAAACDEASLASGRGVTLPLMRGILHE